MPTTTLSTTEARQIFLASQGFGEKRSRASSGWRRIETVLNRLSLLQIDSVNAVVRSHYLPAFSRLGTYDRRALDRRTLDARGRTCFEYWAHEASFLPFELFPLLRWRMDRAARHEGIYSGLAAFAVQKKDYVESVFHEIADRGPSQTKDLSDPGQRGASWWGWSDGKKALEYLFWVGRITTVERRGFTRIYDLTERVIPEEIYRKPAPGEADAVRELVRLSASAMGVATESDLRDYFRLPLELNRTAVAELVEAGELIPVSVEGWRHPAYLAKEAPAPRRCLATGVLSPFDPLVWERDRTERIFGFRYRLELYTPEPKREFGYYVLPFLMNGTLVGRVDVRSDRQADTLRVPGAFAERGVPVAKAADALAKELRLLADWLELDHIAIGDKGQLSKPLKTALAS